MGCELTWGDLLLHSEPEVSHVGADYWFETLGASFDLGRPQPVTQTVESFLQDGSLVTRQRDDNRTISFYIWVNAADGEGLARGERALFLMCQQQWTEAKWTPPAEFSSPSCFQVLVADIGRADVSGAMDADFEELARCRRCYQVTWTCLPYALAESATSFGVTQPATPLAPTLVTDGSSMSRVTMVWGTGHSNGSQILLDTLDTPIGGTANGQSYTLEAIFDLTGLTTGDAASSAYIYIDLNGITPQRKTSSGLVAPTSSYAIGNGYIRYSWLISEADTSFDLFYSASYFSPDPSLPFGFDHRTVNIDQIYLSNQLPVPAGSEQVLTAQIDGSARTTGSLLVSHPTAGLGQTIVYSSPQLEDGYAPPVRRFQVGTTTNLARPGSAAFFSTTWTLLNGAVFEIPVSALPSGPFEMHGHLFASATAANGAVTWTAQLKVGGTLVGPVQTASSDMLALAASTDVMVSLGGMTLPPLGVQSGSSAAIRIVFSAPASLYVDDLFLLYQGDDASLTIVDCGTGTPVLGGVHNSLWLESPAVSNGGIPQLLVGVNGDKTTAIFPPASPQAWEVPKMPPGALHVFIATAAVASPNFSGTYRAAFHTHVAARAS